MSKAKIPESEATSSDFSEQEIRQRTSKSKTSNGQDKEKEKPKKEPPQFLRNMPIMIKYENLILRTIWTIIMLGGFIVIFYAGHFYTTLLCIFVSMGTMAEILELRRNKEKDQHIPSSKFLLWYFYFITQYFAVAPTYWEFPNIRSKSWIIEILAKNHNITSLTLWLIGFVGYVLSLKQGFYKYQMTRFAWAHLTCMIVVYPCACCVANVYRGVIWFIFPTLLVIFNDIMAYVFGYSMGKHKLIELSPKKTWEGFIGGMASTLVIAFYLAQHLQTNIRFVCPSVDFSAIPFQVINCEIPPVFIPLSRTYFGYNFMISDFQLHALVFSLFASLISPFGGFFGSGLKRALKVKDFGESIPGHGGITDRMDCQFLTNLFVYVYYTQFVFDRTAFIKNITVSVLTELNLGEKLTLFKLLGDNLKQLGALQI